jgi:hypothetical protein
MGSDSDCVKGGKYVGILDITHVVEYLWKAGNALHRGGSAAMQRWVYNHLRSLLEGKVGRRVTSDFDQATVESISA